MAAAMIWGGTFYAVVIALFPKSIAGEWMLGRRFLFSVMFGLEIFKTTSTTLYSC
jgi:hypothetical protein